MAEENYPGEASGEKDHLNRSLNFLPERMDEIINQVQNDNSVADALINNKNFYNNFNSILSELNEVFSGREENNREHMQFPLFLTEDHFA